MGGGIQISVLEVYILYQLSYDRFGFRNLLLIWLHVIYCYSFLILWETFDDQRNFLLCLYKWKWKVFRAYWTHWTIRCICQQSSTDMAYKCHVASVEQRTLLLWPAVSEGLFPPGKKITSISIKFDFLYKIQLSLFSWPHLKTKKISSRPYKWKWKNFIACWTHWTTCICNLRSTGAGYGYDTRTRWDVIFKKI